MNVCLSVYVCVECALCEVEWERWMHGKRSNCEGFNMLEKGIVSVGSHQGYLWAENWHKYIFVLGKECAA